MNHTMARLRGAGSLLLNPERLIDLVLDRLDELSVAVMPAQAELIPISRIERPAERLFD